MNRREALKTLAGVGVAVIGGCATPRRPELIRAENDQPGTRDWLPVNGRVKGGRCPWIEGYCSKTSVRPGESIQFFVSTDPASSFTIDFYRMGYYQGLGGRHLLRLGAFPGKPQDVPAPGPRRIRECRWEPCAALTIPQDWPSGVYLGKLTAEREKVESFVIFVVRDDREADVMVQVSDTTWQAYNEWPGKWSMYYHDERPGQMGYHGAETAVSFNRPYEQFRISKFGAGAGCFFGEEFPFTFWLEKEGVDVTYVSCLDTHADPAGLGRVKGFFSVAHDEYYTRAMFENLKGAIGKGLNVAFLSGNTCYEMIEITPQRSMRRVAIFGEHDPAEDGVIEYGRPQLAEGFPSEATLIGAETIFPVMSCGDWTCAKPDHWLFEGTGMKAGESIPGLVGYEWHGRPAPIPGLEILARGIARANTKELVGEYTATIYPGPRGNFVFNASTIWWVNGLSAPPAYKQGPWYGVAPKGVDSRVQRMTANVISRMRI
jgi:hypothetical protein